MVKEKKMTDQHKKWLRTFVENEGEKVFHVSCPMCSKVCEVNLDGIDDAIFKYIADELEFSGWQYIVSEKNQIEGFCCSEVCIKDVME